MPTDVAGLAKRVQVLEGLVKRLSFKVDNLRPSFAVYSAENYIWEITLDWKFGNPWTPANGLLIENIVLPTKSAVWIAYQFPHWPTFAQDGLSIATRLILKNTKGTLRELAPGRGFAMKADVLDPIVVGRGFWMGELPKGTYDVEVQYAFPSPGKGPTIATWQKKAFFPKPSTKPLGNNGSNGGAAMASLQVLVL
jgi:hypothetical protein